MDVKLKSELEDILHRSKSIRIAHCIKWFLTWRDAGLSPNQIREQYGLDSHDMYYVIIDEVQEQTGIDRDDLLKYPGRGRGEHCVISRNARIQTSLSEAQQLIQVYQKLSEQATILQNVIRTTIIGGKT